MSGVSNSHQDVDIDLAQLARAVWQRRLRVVIVTGAVAALAFVGAKMMSPQYKSETRLVIEQRAPAFATTDTDAKSSDALLDALNISSQVQILQSADLIKQVIKNLKLYDLPEFDPAASTSALSDILAVIGLKKGPLDNAPEERVLDAFVERLQVYQISESRVIGISFTSKDPKLAAAVPNAMADVYLAIQSGAKLDSNSEATRWLEPEIANLREKVNEAEKKVADYRSSFGLLQTNGTNTFTSQQLNDISLELARVRGEKANAQARAQAVRNALSSGLSTDTLQDVVSSASIQRLKATESGIESQISDLSTTLLSGHPKLKSLRAQLDDIREQIKRETQKVLSSLENEAKVADLREKQLMQQSNTLKADTARAGEDQVGLNELEREANAQRQLLETYLSRYREAASRSDKNSSPADARVVSSAVEPNTPYFPKVGPIVIVAALAAFILHAIVIMLAELFSGRALRPTEEADVEERRVDDHVVDAHHDIPASAMQVPADDALASEMEAAVASDAPHPVPAEDDEDYSIQAVAEYLLGGETHAALCVSPSGDDGSTATVMLARLLADAGARVILIDMTGSACPTRLMAESRTLPGVTDLLSSEAAFADTIHADRMSDAHIMPQGTSDIRRAMRGADRLSIIMGALSSAYDVVLIECGAADIQNIGRFSRGADQEIILSLPEFDGQQFIEVMETFEAAGFEHLVLMSGLRETGVRLRDRYAA